MSGGNYDYFDEEVDGDGDERIVHLMGAVSLDILTRIYSKDWVIGRFGPQYHQILIPTERLAAHIDLLFLQPAVNLGLDFTSFQFGDDPEEADDCNELLSEIGSMDQRFEIYYEGSSSVPQAWFENYLDTALAARFIPLLRSSDGHLLYHGPHFFTLLNFSHAIRTSPVSFRFPLGRTMRRSASIIGATITKA